jgi:hypothetical protein
MRATRPLGVPVVVRSRSGRENPRPSLRLLATMSAQRGSRQRRRPERTCRWTKRGWCALGRHLRRAACDRGPKFGAAVTRRRTPSHRQRRTAGSPWLGRFPPRPEQHRLVGEDQRPPHQAQAPKKGRATREWNKGDPFSSERNGVHDRRVPSRSLSMLSATAGTRPLRQRPPGYASSDVTAGSTARRRLDALHDPPVVPRKSRPAW